MQCRPNTHKPSFHVNMVGLEKTQRSNSSKYPWDLDAEMMDEEEEEFELRLRQALAPGRFFETFKRRKSWGPFKFPQKKGKMQWRRTSTWMNSHCNQNGTAFVPLLWGLLVWIKITSFTHGMIVSTMECDLVIPSKPNLRNWAGF